jgi:uncharacterized repeat protein (TIGR01451 family)
VESGDLTASGDADLGLDFGFVPLVGVGDEVWNDSDRDGVRDTGEIGASGVTVTLLTAAGAAAVDAYGTPVAAAVSDADGHYSFGDLRPGQYRVEFGARAGYDFTVAGAGDSATDSDANTTTGITPAFTVAPSVAGDTRAAVAGDDVGDALFVNATIDAGYRLVQYDISVVKEFGSANTSARRITWDFTVANAGPDASTATVVVTDALPSTLSFVSGGSTDFPCTAVERTVTCEHPGGLASGESFDFSIVTSYRGYPSTLANSATVAGGAADTAASNNASSAEVPSGTLPKPPKTPKPPVAPTTPTTPGTSDSSGSVDATPSPSPSPTVDPTPELTPSATESPLPEPSPSASETPTDSAVAAELPWGWIIGVLLALLVLIGAAVVIVRRR